MEHRKRPPAGLILTLSVACFAMMADFAIYPASNTIYSVFEGTSMVLLNFIITGPSLTVIFGSIVCGIMTQYVDKKTLLTGAYLVFLLALIPVFIENVLLLAVIRGITGISMGFISVASSGLIVELFMDEKERSRMMGMYTGAMSLIGAILSVISGYLAIINWSYVFITYVAAIPILLGILFFVPKSVPEGKKADGSDPKEQMPWGKTFCLAAAAFVFHSCFAVIMTMMSVYLAERNLGDSSTAGAVSMVTCISGMVLCFAFSVVYDKSKQYTPVIFSALMGCAFGILAFPLRLTAVFIAVAIAGAMYGLAYSYYLMYASVIVPPSKASLSISIISAAVYAGYFCGPYVCPLFKIIPGLTDMLTVMPCLAAVCGIYALLSLTLILKKKRKPA